MMNGIWGAMVLLSLLFGMFGGFVEQLNDSMIQGAMEAVSLVLKMAGGFALWCGLMEILQRCGAVEALTKWIHPVLKRLFPDVRGEEAFQSITMNLTANMLGLGNAATPMGVRAMSLMAQESGDKTVASRAMCMFLVLNASSVQFFPSTVITLRAAMGSANPGAVILPTLVATLASTVVGITACLIFENRRIIKHG